MPDVMSDAGSTTLGQRLPVRPTPTSRRQGRTPPTTAVLPCYRRHPLPRAQIRDMLGHAMPANGLPDHRPRPRLRREAADGHRTLGAMRFRRGSAVSTRSKSTANPVGSLSPGPGPVPIHAATAAGAGPGGYTGESCPHGEPIGSAPAPDAVPTPTRSTVAAPPLPSTVAILGAALIASTDPAPGTVRILSAASVPGTTLISRVALMPGTVCIPSPDPTPGTALVPSAVPTPCTALIPSPDPTPGTAVIPSTAPTLGTALIPSAVPTPCTALIPSPDPTPGTALIPNADPTPGTAVIPSTAPTLGTTLIPGTDPPPPAALTPSADFTSAVAFALRRALRSAAALAVAACCDTALPLAPSGTAPVAPHADSPPSASVLIPGIAPPSARLSARLSAREPIPGPACSVSPGRMPARRLMPLAAPSRHP